MSFKATFPTPEDTMVIREIAPGVTTLSVPFLRFGHIKFGGRATVVKLPSGSLAVFSPVGLTAQVKEHLSNSPVKYLIAPDIEHHIHLSTWHAAYPSSLVLAPEGLAEKRAKSNHTDKSVTIVPFHTIFTKENKASVKVDEEFDREFEYEYVETHPNKELVFFHKASKTLIEADLLFNLPAIEQFSKTNTNPSSGILTKLFHMIGNTKGEAIGQRRAIWYAFSSSDRDAFNKSVRRINGWGFDNIVPCHGETILGQGKEVWEKVFKWHLEGKK